MNASSTQVYTPADSLTQIHPTAIVSPGARVGPGCYIGPYVILGDEVKLGSGVRIDSHCVIEGRTSIGDEVHIFPFASIGLAPQDLKYSGEVTETEIGRGTHIRE